RVQEVERAQARRKRSEEVQERAKTQDQEIQAAIQELVQLAATPLEEGGKVPEPSPVQNELLRSIVSLKEMIRQGAEAREELTEAHEEEERELVREIDLLQNLAALGILAAAFGHETLS